MTSTLTEAPRTNGTTRRRWWEALVVPQPEQSNDDQSPTCNAQQHMRECDEWDRQQVERDATNRDAPTEPTPVAHTPNRIPGSSLTYDEFRSAVFGAEQFLRESLERACRRADLITRDKQTSPTPLTGDAWVQRFEEHERFYKLNEIQTQTIRLQLQFESTESITERLCVCKRTIARHMKKARRIVGCRNDTELLLRAQVAFGQMDDEEL